MKKTGFSLSEILIFLLVISVVVGILAPVFTKKKVLQTVDIPHGSFSCTHDGSNFISALNQGGVISATKSPIGCTFTPPVRARFFVITLVGAGAGGETPTAERITESNSGDYSLNCASGAITLDNPLEDAFDDTGNSFMNALLGANNFKYTLYGGAGGWISSYGRRAQWCGPVGLNMKTGNCKNKLKPGSTQWAERAQPGAGGATCEITFDNKNPLKVGDKISCLSGENGTNASTVEFKDPPNGDNGTFNLARGSGSSEKNYKITAYGGAGAKFKQRHYQEHPADANADKKVTLPNGREVFLYAGSSAGDIRPIGRHGINSGNFGTCKASSGSQSFATLKENKGLNLNHKHQLCTAGEVSYDGRYPHYDYSYQGDNKGLSEAQIRDSYLSLLIMRVPTSEKSRIERDDDLAAVVTKLPEASWKYALQKKISYTKAPQGGGRGQVVIVERPVIPGLVNGVLTIVGSSNKSAKNVIGMGGASDINGDSTQLNGGTLSAPGGKISKSAYDQVVLEFASSAQKKYGLRIDGLDGEKSLFDGLPANAPAPKGGQCPAGAVASQCVGALSKLVGSGGGGGSFYFSHSGAYGKATFGNAEKAKGNNFTSDVLIRGRGGKGASGGIYISW